MSITRKQHIANQNTIADAAKKILRQRTYVTLAGAYDFAPKKSPTTLAQQSDREKTMRLFAGAWWPLDLAVKMLKLSATPIASQAS